MTKTQNDHLKIISFTDGYLDSNTNVQNVVMAGHAVQNVFFFFFKCM